MNTVIGTCELLSRPSTLEIIKRGSRYDIIAMPSIHNVSTTPHVGGESWMPTTPVSLEDGYWSKFVWLDSSVVRIRRSKSCRRAVRQRGRIERCMRSTATGRWDYCSLRRSNSLAALEDEGYTGLTTLFSTSCPVV